MNPGLEFNCRTLALLIISYLPLKNVLWICWTFGKWTDCIQFVGNLNTLFLLWINSKPWYFVPDRQCCIERGMGECRYNLTGPDYVACVFDFHYLSIVQINCFRRIPIYYEIVSQSFRFGVNLFSPSAPCWGPEKKFSTGTETRFCRPCWRGRFKTTVVVTVFIVILLTAAIVTDIWW